MATKKKSESVEEEVRQLPPVLTDEAQESRCISLAYALVEKRLMEGTASSSETVHFLKLGSSRERKEQAMLDKQIELTDAKTGNIKASERMEELYSNAIEAMRRYQGQTVEDVIIFNE